MSVPKEYFKRKNSKQGLALSTVMVICIVLTILVAMLVGMASLNITTTQATVNERSSYIEAKSAISYVEAYYALNMEKIPGYGESKPESTYGKGIVVFKGDDLSAGADFYTIKNGNNVIINYDKDKKNSSEVTVETLQNESVGRYVEVSLSKSDGLEYLTLNAVVKPKTGNSGYSLAKEYNMNASETISDAFTGSWLNEASDGTRYVRFHVKATAAFPSEPYFYMWYRDRDPETIWSPSQGKMIENTGFDKYGQSSIVNMLTKTSNYSNVILDTWGSDGPQGNCAMSYEGNGWYVTQKTFNLNRHAEFVNGIITYYGATRGDDNNNDHKEDHTGEYDKQSFEFFGIPIPKYTEIGQDNGVDIYFEPVRGKLFDFNGRHSGGYKDWFTGFVKGENDAYGTGGNGLKYSTNIQKLNDLAQFTASYYNVYTRTESSIMHYRVAKEIERNNGSAPDGFMYEGYGWWRCIENTTFQGSFGSSVSTPNGITYYFSNGEPKSIEDASRRTIVREQFVCYDPDSNESASFATEEEANEWFIRHGDLNAAKYVEVNVRSQVQPVDAPIKTEITYSTNYYGDDAKPATTYPGEDYLVEQLASKGEELELATLEVKDEELETKKLAASLENGDFFLIDSQNNYEGYNTWNQTAWKDLSHKMTPTDDNPFVFYYDFEDVPDGEEFPFIIIQRRPKSKYWGDGGINWNNSWGFASGYYWIDEGSDWFRPTSSTGKLRVYFDTQQELVTWTDFSDEDTDSGDDTSSTVSEDTSSATSSSYSSVAPKPEQNFDEEDESRTYYSVIGWRNNWGRGDSETEEVSEYPTYVYTTPMYENTQGKYQLNDAAESMIITDGDAPRYFFIAERNGKNSGAVDWSRVYGTKEELGSDPVGVAAESAPASFEEADLTAKYAVKIEKKVEEGKRPRKWEVSIIYDPETHVASVEYKEIEDDEKFYILGGFNNWFSVVDEDGNETLDENYDLTEAEAYRFTRSDEQNNENEIVYTYTLRNLQEKGTYTVRVASSDGKKVKLDDAGNEVKDENGNPVYYTDYDYTWALNKDTGELKTNNTPDRSDTEHPDYHKKIEVRTEDNDVKGLLKSKESKSISYELPGRYYVTFEFTYNKEKQTVGGLKIIATKYTSGKASSYYHVGFYNAKLTNVNDDTHKSDSQFNNPWTDSWTDSPSGGELVYVTFYTEETGFNCFRAKQEKAADGTLTHNWWYDVPSDAEYVYFSNRPSSIYKYTHSNEFEYTDKILNAQFKSTEGMIFFPIRPVEDKETYAGVTRTRWTVGDSEKYFEYINKAIVMDNKVEEMAYYGSTQCSYYDSPIVNVLKTIASQGYYNRNYEFQSYYDSSHRNVISYQGEKFYFCEISGDSRLKLRINGNWNSYEGYIYENQMSNEWEGGRFNKSDLYEQDRAGGMFVSDRYYRNGDTSYLNYSSGNPYGGMAYAEPSGGSHYRSASDYNQTYTNVAKGSGSGTDFGYTPNWYTYRIPCTGQVTIKSIRGVRKNESGLSGTSWWIFENSASYTPVKESANHNLPIYIYQEQTDAGEIRPRCYSYDFKEGMVDCVPRSVSEAGSDTPTRVRIYFDNSETGWDTIMLHAYSPIVDNSVKMYDRYINLTHATSGDFGAGGPDTSDGDGNGYYYFEFDQGQYAFYQFYKGSSESGLTDKEKLEKAVGEGNASGILYFNGLELGQSTDKGNTLYSGLDDRTTQLLCKGTASSLTWYMHPRNKRFYAYHDISAAAQSTISSDYYGYNRSSGTYSVHGSTLSISKLTTEKNNAKSAYEGRSSWTSPSDSSSSYNSILALSRAFNDIKAEARKYASDDISKATSDDWRGTDQTKRMVFLEGEQLATEIFAYDQKWTDRLKDTYKKYLLSPARYTSIDNRGTSIYRNGVSDVMGEMQTIINDLNKSLENKKCTIKKDAVRILINDKQLTLKDGTVTGGWGRSRGSLSGDQYRAMRLWYKDTDDSGKPIWKKVNAQICKTTQTDFYGFAFLLDDSLTGKKVTIATSQPSPGTGDNADSDYINGRKIATTTLQKGFSYRFTTSKADQATSKNIDAKTFIVDKSLENQSYSGTQIDYNDEYTKDMNEFYPMKVGNDFWLTFKYDTKVVRPSGDSYTIYAGAYKIQPEMDSYGEPGYPGYYTDFYRINNSGVRTNQHLTNAADAAENAAKFDSLNGNVAMGFCGIDVYSDNAKAFFTNPETYGMKKANSFSSWTQNRVNSKIDIDLMVSSISAGDKKASAPGKTVSFRVQALKDDSRLQMMQNIRLEGETAIIATNKLDFRGSNSGNEFEISAKTIIFKTDTVVYRPNGTTVTIAHGRYKYNPGSGLSAARILAETTDNEENKTDWRRRYTLTSDAGSELEGGKYVAN